VAVLGAIAVMHGPREGHELLLAVWAAAESAGQIRAVGKLPAELADHCPVHRLNSAAGPLEGFAQQCIHPRIELWLLDAPHDIALLGCCAHVLASRAAESVEERRFIRCQLEGKR